MADPGVEAEVKRALAHVAKQLEATEGKPVLALDAWGDAPHVTTEHVIALLLEVAWGHDVDAPRSPPTVQP